jgi:hypothetical protein
MGVLVGVLKLAGAAVALTTVLVRPGLPRRRLQLLGVLAVWFHRRHHLEWTVVVAGLVGAPLPLGLLLAVPPRSSSVWACCPADRAAGRAGGASRGANLEAVGAQCRGGLRRSDVRRGRCDLGELRKKLPDLVLAPEGGADAVVGDRRRHHQELGLRRVQPLIHPVCAFHVGLLPAAAPS